MTSGHALLEVEGLDVSYRTDAGSFLALRDATFSLGAGEALGLVGESGSGKTTLGLAVMRYLPGNGGITAGSIRFDGTDLVPLSRRALTKLRGHRIAMVYQDPASALNPSLRVGDQIAEVYRTHLGLSGTEAHSRAETMLDVVQLPDPSGAYDRYPHQFSGGQQQRIVIAMALAMDPSLLVLDEPTTGLDVTVESEIMDLFAALRHRVHAAIIFISHDIGLVAQLCERVAVLYQGRFVETGPTSAVFARPAHPYTRGLLACRIPPGAAKDRIRLQPLPLSDTAGSDTPVVAERGCSFEPRCSFAQERCTQQEPALYEAGKNVASRCYFHGDVVRAPAPGGRAADTPVAPHDGQRPDAPLLDVRGLRKVFRSGGRELVAVADASFSIARGRVLGIVGESGSGKTTLARMIAGLETPDQGSVWLNGSDVTRPAHKRPVEARRALQMVFQHPDGTLNPSYRVAQILRRQVGKLAGVGGNERDERIESVLRAVHLAPGHLRARPRELSGGQRQRVAIARAFSTRPELVVLDEPTSALDVSVQAAILNLLIDLQQRERSSYLLISHDLATVRYLADDILVMHRGEIVEWGPAAEVFDAPREPYTRRLLSAVTDNGERAAGPVPA